MKKFYTLLAGLFISLSLFAFHGSRMNISIAASPMDFRVELNGQKVRMAGNSTILNNLSEGYHNIRVYRVMNYYLGKQIINRVQEIIYATTVYLGSDYQADISINGSGKVVMSTYRIDRDNDFDVAYRDHYGFDGADLRSGGNYRSMNYSNVMSDREFDQLTKQIGKEWSDATRMISVKTILAKNNFTTLQIKQLMELFVFESNRLEVVKSAYRNIVDKQNIYELMDVLAFNSSKDELARFIRES